MSFLSNQSLLTLGSRTNTTMNIGIDSNILNIGTSQDGNVPSINIGIRDNGSNINSVRIRGLDPIITSNTKCFSSIVSYIPLGNTATTNFYLLPYNNTQDLCIQWGYYPDVTGIATVNFYLIDTIGYASVPYAYITNFIGGNGATARINSISVTNMTVDSSVGSDNKAPFNWMAIGLRNKG